MTYLGDTGPEAALGPLQVGSVHLPDRAGAPGGPESAELANRFLPYKRRHPIEMARLRVMGGVETQQLSQQGAHERPRLQAEQHQHAEQRLYVYLRSATPKPVPLPASMGRCKVG